MLKDVYGAPVPTLRNPTPSEADRDITFLLKQALSLVDIKVIDHIIVGHQKCLSLAELGQI